MTFLELKEEAAKLRFNINSASSLTRVGLWINLRYSWLWDAADWTFKKVPATNLTVTNGAATEPADLGKVNAVYDPRGDELAYIDRDSFERDYVAPVPALTGLAEAYTVIDRQIMVGPPESGTFKVAYERRISHLDTGVVTAGVMDEDSDLPLFPSEHHYILVIEACILGMQLQKDDGWRDLIPQRDELFKAMVADLTTDVHTTRFWGTDVHLAGVE